MTDVFNRDTAGVRKALRNDMTTSLTFHALEPRIAFDAAMVATAIAETHEVIPVEHAPPAANHSAPPTVDAMHQLAQFLHASETHTDGPAHAGSLIVFIDASVIDRSVITAALPDGAEVVVLDPHSDGLAQIARHMQGHHDVTAVHIVSHGAAGELVLGSTVIDADQLAMRATELRTIGSAMTAEGDILLYGCDVASGNKGAAFIASLATATGADVAASTDKTGSAALDADWDLEAEIGSIEAFHIVASNWDHDLAELKISAKTAPVVRDNTGVIVTAANVGGVVRHITDVSKMVGATATWQNAGTIGSTAIDLRATVLAVSDTNSGTGLTYDPSLNFAISNGDDPSVRIESASVSIKWLVYEAGTTVQARGDVGFFIRDIDALGNLYDGSGALQYVNLSGAKPQESVRAKYDQIARYETEDAALTHLTVGLNIDPDTGKAVSDPTHPSYGMITATNLQATEFAGSVSGIKFYWNTVSSWEVSYRVAPPPGVLSFDGPYTFDGKADTSFRYNVQGQRFFDHDGNGDLKFTNATVATLRILDLDKDDSSSAGTGYKSTFNAGGPGVTIVDADVDISGADTRINNATVILTNAKPDDVLSIDGRNQIQGTVNGLEYTVSTGKGTITISLVGKTTDASEYEAALQLIRYSNTSLTPDATARTIEISYSNGSVSSNIAIAKIEVVAKTYPVSRDDLGSGAAHLPIAVAVLGNDSATGAALAPDSIEIEGTAGPGMSLTVVRQGVWSVDTAAGSIVFTPERNFTGAPTPITYTVRDSFGLRSNSATVSVLPLGSELHLDVSGSAPTIGAIAYSHDDGTGNSPAWESAAGVERFASVTEEVAGRGLKLSVLDPTAYISAVASQTLAEAISADDYVAMSFTTLEALPETWIHEISLRLSDGPFKIAFLISDDGFKTATILSRDNAADASTGSRDPSLADHIIIPTTDYKLLGAITYEVRAYIYDMSGGPSAIRVWDDLKIRYADDPAGYETKYTERDSAVDVASVKTQIEDSYSRTCQSGIVSLLNAQAGDILRIGGTPVAAGDSGLIGTIAYQVSENGGALTIDLTGMAKHSDYAEALAAISFEASSINPDTTDRVIDITLSDGKRTSNVARTIIHVTAIDDAPIIDLNSAAAQNDNDRDTNALFIEGDTAKTIVPSNSSISDREEFDIVSLTIVTKGMADGRAEQVTIAERRFDLTISAAHSVTVGSTIFSVDYDATSGTFTIFSTADKLDTVARGDLETLMHSITYENTSQHPTEGSRSLTFVATDRAGNASTPATAFITVSGVNDTPTLTLDASNGTVGSERAGSYETTLVEGGAPIALVNPETALSLDPEDMISALTIVVGDRPDHGSELLSIGGHVIGLHTQHSGVLTIGKETLRYTYDQSSGQLSIVAADQQVGATGAAFTEILRSATYQNLADEPTATDRTFSFELTDIGGLTSNRVVSTVHIVPLPDAADDAITIDEDARLTRINPLANDDLGAGVAVTRGLTIITPPAVTEGLLSFVSDGGNERHTVENGTKLSASEATTLAFKPAVNTHGVVRIPYLLTDINGAISGASMLITVRSIDDPVQIIDPSDPTSDPHSAAYGPIDPSSAGYDPSNPRSIAMPDRLIADVRTTDGATPAVIQAGRYFADAEHDKLTFSAAGLPPGLTIDADTGKIHGIIDAAASRNATQGNPDGMYRAVVTAKDSAGNIASTAILYAVRNLPPIAVDDRSDVSEDDALATGNVLSGRTDPTDPLTADHDAGPDSDPLFVIAASQSGRSLVLGAPFITDGGGTLTIGADGSYAFEPGKAYDGLDGGEALTETITYTISDGNGGSATAVLVLTIIGRNDAPTTFDPRPGNADLSAHDRQALPPIAAADFFFDPDGEPLIYALASTGTPAWLAIDPLTGFITGTPPGNASIGSNVGSPGAYEITISATDPDGATTTTTLRLAIVNLQPTAVDDSADAGDERPITIRVLANDTDASPDNDPLTVKSATAAHGSVVIGSDGTLTYTAHSGFEGTDIITYQISDGNGGTATAIVRVMVSHAHPLTDAETVVPFSEPRYFTESISADGAVVAAVVGMQRIDGTFEPGSRLLGDRSLNDIESIGSFSLKLASSPTGDRPVIETFVRGHTVIVNLGLEAAADTEGYRQNASRPGDIEWKVLQANGRPIPEWLGFVGTNSLYADFPANVDSIDLRVTALSRGESIFTNEVRIQARTGEIQPLTIGRPGGVAPALFWEQLAMGEQLKLGPSNTAADIAALANVLRLQAAE